MWHLFNNDLELLGEVIKFGTHQQPNQSVYYSITYKSIQTDIEVTISVNSIEFYPLKHHMVILN